MTRFFGILERRKWFSLVTWNKKSEQAILFQFGYFEKSSLFRVKMYEFLYEFDQSFVKFKYDNYLGLFYLV
jgi:hypothetical protein